MAAFMLWCQNWVDAMETVWACKAKNIYLQKKFGNPCSCVWEPSMGGICEGLWWKRHSPASSPPTRYILFSWFIYFLFSSLDHHITSISLISLYMLFIFYQLHSTIKLHVSRDFCLFCSYILKPWPVPGTQVGTPHIFVEWINMDFMEKKVVQPKCVGGFLFHGLSLNF